MATDIKTVALFASCPVDLFRPSVGMAAVQLLEAAGFNVVVPEQTCCGQVNANAGEDGQARDLAWQLVQAFDGYDFTVVPSGSCGGMIKHHYPSLFANDPRESRVRAFCSKVYELTTFLTEFGSDDFLQSLSPLPSVGTVTYHDSCAGLREMGIKQQPRQLLATANVPLTEMVDTNICCGFGGSFCVKFGDVSAKMADQKLDNAVAVGAKTLVGGDVACLLHLAGRAKRRGLDIECRHVAEVLAGIEGTPAIGDREQ